MIAEQNPVAIQPQSALRTALAGLIGNVLEWFDFAVYGYFASDIGRQFFPQSSPTAQQLLAFAVFALGFCARPIGSLVLGRVGDRIGRRALLTLSIALMGGATLLIGLLPTYAQIGVAAPMLLVMLRVDPGLLARRRVHRIDGLHDRAGLAAGARAGQQLDRGGHDARVHPRVGVGVARQRVARRRAGGRVGLARPVHRQRHACASSAGCCAAASTRPSEGLKAAADPSAAASRRSSADWRPIVQTFGIVAMTNAAYYLTFTYAVERRKQPDAARAARRSCSRTRLSLFVVLFAKPLGGWLSDKIGRRRLMMALTVVDDGC